MRRLVKCGRRSAWALGLLTAPLLWVASCAGDDAGRDKTFYSGPVNRCSTGQCRGLSRCDVEHDLCALKGPHTAREFFLEIFLSGEEGVAPRRRKITIAQPPVEPSTDINVSEAVTVRSNVKINSCDARIGILARVIFTRKAPVIPGVAAPVDVVRASGATKSFEVELAPGVYDVHVRPVGEYRGQVPPARLSAISVTPGGALVDGQDNELSCLAVSTQGTRISGRVTRAGVAANGLTVEAINTQRRPTRSASTTAVTSCLDDSGLSDRCGRFEILTNDPIDDLALRILRPEDPRYPITTEDLPAAGSDGLRRLELPGINLPVPLLLTVRGADAEPILGATVQVESSDIGRGFVRLSLKTNELGEIESLDGSPGVALYPGTYRVDVSPPIQSAPTGHVFGPQSLTQLEIVAGAEPIERTVILTPSPLAYGTVTAGGMKVPKARYTVEPENTFSHQPVLTGATDDSGALALPPTSESLTIVIRPPEQSRYPWLVETGVVVDGGGSAPVFELDDPFVWEATIRGRDGSPISEARIDWYTLYDGRPYLVARSTADSAGRVLALLPP